MTQRELKQAVKLLYAAAGIQHLSVERVNASAPAAAQPDYLTAASVRLVLRNDTLPHQGALKELVYVYREGAGGEEEAVAEVVEGPRRKVPRGGRGTHGAGCQCMLSAPGGPV